MSSSNNNNFFVVFGLLFGAVCWGIIWFPYRLLADAGISGIVSSFYTYSIAILIGVAVFARQWRGMLKLPASIIWLGLAAGWTNVSYVLAIIEGEVMRVMLLFYLSPLWTLILAHCWLKEKTQMTGYIAIAASLLGAFIMLYEPQAGFPLPRNTSEWLALSSGIGFSLTNVITRKSSHLTLTAKAFAVWTGVLAVAVVFIILDAEAFLMPADISGFNWLIIVLIALALMAATLFVQYGVTRIEATRASVLFLFELVVAAIASYYLADEHMAVKEWVGGGLIVVAAIFAASNHNHR